MGLGTRQKVSSRKISLESNTYVQESNELNLTVQLPLSETAKILDSTY
jgi:hypothetical protein